MKIIDLLRKLNLSKKKSTYLFKKSTRDNKKLKVYRDHESGVIFIKSHFNEKTYYDYKYNDLQSINKKEEIEDIENYKRRTNRFKELCKNKKILDFGCGSGSFLIKNKSVAKEVCGVELNHFCRKFLNKKKIDCKKDMLDFPNNYFDTIFSFHVFEHLNNPINFLRNAKKKLKKNGTLVIEVPHANDALINFYKSNEFIKFTLWSQHLILHTEKSLNKFFKKANYKNISIEGCQRFKISNHLHWLSNGKPGGQKTFIKKIQTKELEKAYDNSLIKNKLTDTLYVIAKK